MFFVEWSAINFWRRGIWEDPALSRCSRFYFPSCVCVTTNQIGDNCWKFDRGGGRIDGATGAGWANSHSLAAAIALLKVSWGEKDRFWKRVWFQAPKIARQIHAKALIVIPKGGSAIHFLDSHIKSLKVWYWVVRIGSFRVRSSKLLGQSRIVWKCGGWIPEDHSDSSLCWIVRLVFGD